MPLPALAEAVEETPDPAGQLSARTPEGTEGRGEAHAAYQREPERVEETDHEPGRDHTADALHSPVEPASQDPTRLGVVPGRKDLPALQCGGEGGRRSEQQEDRPGDGPPGQAVEQEQQSADHSGRRERQPGQPEKLGDDPGSRIPQKRAASAHERGAVKQAEGE